MFCGRCGNYNAEGNSFCANCGAPLTKSEPNFGGAPGYSDVSQPEGNWKEPGNVQGSAEKQELGMKWHKAMLVFLVLGALLNGGTAIRFISGMQYPDPELVYLFYGNRLKVLDVSYGVAIFVLAGLDIAAFLKLYGLKTGGPKLLFITYGVNFVSGLIYYSAASILTGMNLFNPGAVGALVGVVIVFFINKTYYDHRKHLFIN